MLRGFDKIKLQPGETKVVPFEVKIDDLAWYDPEAKEWKVEEMEYELYMGPSSSADQLLKDEFEVTNFMK